MNIKDVLSITAGVITLMGLGYAAALQGRYIVNGPIAKAIAQEVLQAEELERMEFQLEYKLNQLRPLQRIDKETRSEEDQDAIDDLKEDISILKKRIAAAKGQHE